MIERAIPAPYSAFRILDWYKTGGDILVFLAISLGMAIFIGQERMISRGDVAYWLLVGPAMLMPLLRVRQTVENLLLGVARPLAAFGTLSGAWFLFQRDFGAIPPIFLIIWVAGWACRAEARISAKTLFALTLVFYLAGIISFATQPAYENYPWLMQHLAQPEAAEGSDVELALPEQERAGLNLNAWGILPGQTAIAFQPWRISAIPNIATSGIFSLMVLLVLVRRFKPKPVDAVTAVTTIYFTVLSFVRAVFVSIALFTATLGIMAVLPNRPGLRVAAALFMTVGLTLLVAFSPFLLYTLQDWGIISRMFLRGQTGMSVADIYRQMYRPWLWGEHMKLFWDSPYLMGHGSELAASALKNIINAGQMRSDSVSFLTRMIATYGIPAFGIVIFLVERCYRHAKDNDIWAVAVISVMVWLMMSWGSIFHPSNGMFALAFLLVGKGSRSFADDRAGVN
ncbi:hypothetical protein [Rhizobium leguminosarum]|uniref:hypothetical protein n=1 Tax=Rhizobium leguminosarum TaxID=384 RepID=UPI0010312D7E|nr:hypothetical protein [Rhizobium leguminosarum]TAV89327.1 hypothetical protein ELI22_08930 [Rhizobium leguminosarum]TAV93908.1 hypothetical protein ELI21_08920 [Rhizobium leguminosarum]TAW34985.1 hypothetical protein ELI23_08960 [Rhizobium leguminosarum]